MRRNILFIFGLLLFTESAVVAQVLNTAETIGKGKWLAFASENRLYVDGFELNIAYGQLFRGVSDRLDLCVAFGDTWISGENQAFMSIGENFRLFRMKGAAVSLYSTVALPLHRRKDSSTVLLNSMLIVSKPISKAITLYSGLNTLFPVGAKERGIFTPPDAKITVPVGAAISRGPWTFFAEGDIGHLKTIGVGIARMF